MNKDNVLIHTRNNKPASAKSLLLITRFTLKQ